MRLDIGLMTFDLPAVADHARRAEVLGFGAIWSAETPFEMSAPAVFLGWTPVRKQAPARAWSPGPSPSA